MGEWKLVKIGQFLKERGGRYDPGDETIQGLKRLNKIDFSGEIHLSDKGSKTDMIVVEPGDLVISGINVSKGAIAVYYNSNHLSSGLMKPSVCKATANSFNVFRPIFFIRRSLSLPNDAIFCGFSNMFSFAKLLFNIFWVRLESSFLRGGHESKFSFLSFARRYICRVLSELTPNIFAISVNVDPFFLRTYIFSSLSN